MFNLLEYILSQTHIDHLKQILTTSKPKIYVEFLINTSIVSLLNEKSISTEDFGFDDEYELRSALIDSIDDNDDEEIKNYVRTILADRKSYTLKKEPSIVIHDGSQDEKKLDTRIDKPQKIISIPYDTAIAARSAEGGDKKYKKKKNIKK